jgi:hypothetical protein
MSVRVPKKNRGIFLLIASLAAGALICAVSPALALNPAQIGELQQKGQNSFRQGVELAATDPLRAMDLFQKAALIFETIVREGGIENGKLYSNIGNCYLRMGDRGRAIVNYLRAERMIPGDPRLAQNLDLARMSMRDEVEPVRNGGLYRTVISWICPYLGFPEQMWSFLSFWGLAWICRSAYLFCKKKWLRYAVFGAAGAALLLFASLAFQACSVPTTGVIVADSVIGREGNSLAFDPAFERPLQSGVEFKLLEKRPGWLHIAPPGKPACWVPASSAEII